MKISTELSQLDILQEVTTLKKALDALRPLTAEQEGRIFQKLRLDWNYHSNAIEGNTLTYGETRALLIYGLTAKGKPFKDHLDIKGHNEAIDFLLALVKDSRPLSEQDIRERHKEDCHGKTPCLKTFGKFSLANNCYSRSRLPAN